MSGGFSVRSLYSDAPTMAAYRAPASSVAPSVAPPASVSPAPPVAPASGSISSFFSKLSPSTTPSTTPSSSTTATTTITGQPLSSASESSKAWWDPFSRRDDSEQLVPIEVPLEDFAATSSSPATAPAASGLSPWVSRLMGRGTDEEFSAREAVPVAEDAAEAPASAPGSFWSRLTGRPEGDGAEGVANEGGEDPEGDDGSWLSRLGRNEDGGLAVPGFPQGTPWFKMFEDEEPDCWKKMTTALGIPSLTLKQRLYGFGICWGIGFILAGLGSALIFNLSLFAVLYTFGNLSNLIGTFFLVGPVKQMRQMFDPMRLIAAIIYLVSMALTLFAALYLRNWVLAICMVLVQSCALIWYLASYVPFARAAIKRVVTSAIESVAGE